MALAAAVAAPGPAPGAQGADTLRGRVVVGTDSSVVEGQKVVLHRVTPDSGSAVDSTVSGPDGEFAFPLPSPGGSGEGPVYLATARYEGVLYLGPAVHRDDPTDGYRIDVYPSERASAASSLTLRSRTFVLAPEGEDTRVMDVIVARGRPGRTVVGSRGDDGESGDRAEDGGAAGRTAWWSVAVPAVARDVAVLPGAVDGSEVTFVPGEARVSAAIPPSGQRVVLGYRVPAGDALELVLRHPAERIEVVAGRGTGELRVPGAREAEPLEVEGERLTRYRLEDRPEGDTVRVLRGGTGSSGGRTAGWIAIAAGVLLAAAAGWAWRRRGSPGRGVGRRDGGVGGGGGP